MISFEFQRKFWGKGNSNQGYCREKWWCFLGITVIHRKPLGIRGLIKNDHE